MPGVFLLSPGPVLIDPNKQTIHSNSTITASSSGIYFGFGTKEITLVVNVKNPPTGSSPTLQFTIQEVDPGDETTVFGSTVSTASITTAGVYQATIRTTLGGNLKVSWTIGGTSSPTFTGVYSTLTTKITTISTGLDPDGNEKAVNLDASGRTLTNVGSWFGSTSPTVGQKAMTSSVPVTFASDQTPLSVSVQPTGSITGYEFGKVALAGGTANTLNAIRATPYTEQTTNAQRSVSSSSANDASAGTGAQQVKITYLDQTGAGPYTETVTMNGLTAVNTTNTNICFIDKLEVVRTGATGSNAGVITLYSTTGGGGVAIGSIGTGNIIAGIGDNRDFWAHHYVPTGKTASLSTVVIGASAASVFFLRSKNPTVATDPDVIITEFLNAPSGASFTRNITFPLKITGPNRIVAWGIPSTNNVTLNASFDFSEQ